MYRCSRALIPLTKGSKALSTLQPTSSRNIFYLTPFSRRPWHPLAIMKQMDREFRQLDSIIHDEFPEWTDTPIVTLANKCEVVKEGDKDIYTLYVHMGPDFPPEDIKVTLKDHEMTVEAKFEKKSEDGKYQVYQKVTRQFNLPDNVDLSEVKSSFTQEGVLKIEAPFPPGIFPEAVKEREIPILKG